MSATTHEPRCGMCRYPVRGLPTFRCPECGNDLRQVGIIATGVRSHATPWQRVGYWTLLFLVAAIPLSALADNLLRWRQGSTAITLLAPRESYDLVFTVTDESFCLPLQRREVELKLLSPLSGRMTISSSLAYTHSTGFNIGSTGPQLTEQVIETWLSGYGLTSSPTFKQEALDLLAMVKAAIADGDLRRRPPVYFEQRGFRYTGTGGGPNTSLILAALVILWAIGAVIAWRRAPRP